MLAESDKPLSMAGLPEVREKFGDDGSVAGALANFGWSVFTILPDCVSPGAVPPINLVPPDPLAKARLFLAVVPVHVVDKKVIPCELLVLFVTAFS